LSLKKSRIPVDPEIDIPVDPMELVVPDEAFESVEPELPVEDADALPELVEALDVVPLDDVLISQSPFTHTCDPEHCPQSPPHPSPPH